MGGRAEQIYGWIGVAGISWSRSWKRTEVETRQNTIPNTKYHEEKMCSKKLLDVLGNILQEWRQVYLGTPGVLRVISIVDIKGGAIENT